MTGEELLDHHRCSLGGPGGIRYILSVSTPGERVNIDVVTRCETASQIVEAGWNSGMLRTYPLLIVGGGAAGVSAALKALSLGVDGVAISSDPVFFSTQRFCVHRYLHPNIYRWPEMGCDSPHYCPPLTGLTWTADYAKAVVEQWDRQTPILFEDGRYQRVAPIPDHQTVNSTADVTRLIFTGSGEQEWGMVLFCIAPKENTTVGSFTGTPFWGADDLDDQNCGCGSDEHRILICGSGDGALQDFLRVSCPNKNIQSLHEFLEAMFDEVVLKTSFDIRVAMKEIGAIPREDFDLIHSRCREVIEKLFSSDVGKEAVARFVARACSAFPSQRSITLVWSRDHFQKCYLLNRFLALLVGKWRESVLDDRVFLPGVRLTEVNSEHDRYVVKFNREDCPIHGESFDRVVPRFGVEDIEIGTDNGTLCIQRKPNSVSA